VSLEMHPCPHCAAGFDSLRSLEHHLKASHDQTLPNEKFRCTTCDAEFMAQIEWMEPRGGGAQSRQGDRRRSRLLDAGSGRAPRGGPLPSFVCRQPSSPPAGVRDASAVRIARYAGLMTSPHHADAVAWAARAPYVDDEWFRRHSRLHGAGHTRRVHVHAQRLLEQLGWERADAELVLHAALWHDIGRESDGVEPEHGRRSAERADELGLTAKLSSADAAIVRFAILRHSLSDSGAAPLAAELSAGEDDSRRLTDPDRALRVLRLLKDADALDRVRLGFGERADPCQLRHQETVQLIPFASALYAVLI
jgi:hypothetical protein